MAKHTKTNCLSALDHFAGSALKESKRAGECYQSFSEYHYLHWHKNCLFFQVLTLSSIPTIEILIWGLVSKEMKKITTLNEFNVKIKI